MEINLPEAGGNRTSAISKIIDAIKKSKELAEKASNSEETVTSKKRKSNPDNWARTKNKKAKDNGEMYQGQKKIDGKWHLVDKAAKRRGDRCQKSDKSHKMLKCA